MKPLMIVVLAALQIFPLMAEDQSQDTAWMTIARQAREQLRQNRFAEAAESGQHALQLARHFGPADTKLAVSYHLLGAVYRDWGHCTQARTNYTRAIAVWRRQPDANSTYIFKSITSLLTTMYECDDLAAAEKSFHDYEPDLERYRSGPKDQADILTIRAVLARARKNYTQAEALYRQAIDLMENISEATPMEIAVVRSSLAVVFDKEGRHADSLAESERALAFFEQAAPRHSSLVESLNNVACSLFELGRKDDAKRMFQRALEAAEDLYGEDNRITAKIMVSYARVLRETTQSPDATTLLKRGAEAFRRSSAQDAGTIDVEELRMVEK